MRSNWPDSRKAVLPPGAEGSGDNLRAVADRLHQRQVPVHFVVPAKAGRLHEHTRHDTTTSQGIQRNVAPTNPTRTVPYTTKAQVSELTTPTNPSNPPNSGQATNRDALGTRHKNC